MFSTILIIEDEELIRQHLKEFLLENRYSVEDAADGLTGLKLAEKIQPDVVLLDLKLPDITGEEVCRRLKKLLPETAVIILTAKDSTPDVVRGLDFGADDYVTKPFNTDELLARIKAKLRKGSGEASLLAVGDLKLDRKKIEVTRDGRAIKLTPQEFKLLEYLMANKNTVLTREMILNKIWQYSPEVETRVVDVYVGYLRNKIDAGSKGKIIHSVRGFGYVAREPK